MARSVSDRLRIGILGGTFDPVHRAHLAIAEAARDQAQLDRVLFVVSAHPPHKRNYVSTPAEDRLAMVEAAVSAYPEFEASDLEIRRPGPSYTVDTLREIRAAHPEAELYLIMGYDAALDLPHWREPQKILEMARLLVLPREGGAPPPLHHDVMNRSTILQFSPIPLSSTEIRESLRRGKYPAHALPEPVLDLIRRKGLYGCR